MAHARIQIVEDEAIIAADIEESLFSLHYDVVGIAASGKDAIDMARLKKPDLILMDINLEDSVDGIEAGGIIGEELDIPIVFLTAIVETSVFERAKKLEPQAYIMKPFRQLELRTVIELALQRHALSRSQDKSCEGIQTSAGSSSEGLKHISIEKQFPKIATFTGNSYEGALATLLKVSPFAELPRPLLDKIAATCTVESTNNFQVFAHEGSEQEYGFIIERGRAAIFKRSSSGKELVIDLIGPDDLFGILEVTTSKICSFSARSQGESQILKIPREVIEYLYQYVPEFNKQVVSLVLDRMRSAHDLSRALAHDRVEVRVASALLALQSRFGKFNKQSGGATLELTRMELAELVGTTPETISRIFARFVEDGALDIRTPRFVTLNSTSYFEELIST